MTTDQQRILEAGDPFYFWRVYNMAGAALVSPTRNTSYDDGNPLVLARCKATPHESFHKCSCGIWGYWSLEQTIQKYFGDIRLVTLMAIVPGAPFIMGTEGLRATEAQIIECFVPEVLTDRGYRRAWRKFQACWGDQVILTPYRTRHYSKENVYLKITELAQDRYPSILPEHGVVAIGRSLATRDGSSLNPQMERLARELRS